MEQLSIEEAIKTNKPLAKKYKKFKKEFDEAWKEEEIKNNPEMKLFLVIYNKDHEISQVAIISAKTVEDVPNVIKTNGHSVEIGKISEIIPIQPLEGLKMGEGNGTYWHVPF